MSERERLHRMTTQRDVLRMRLRKARGALYRIAKMKQSEDETEAGFLDRIKRVAKSGCGQTKKRKTVSLPGQIDLEEWLRAR